MAMTLRQTKRSIIIAAAITALAALSAVVAGVAWPYDLGLDDPGADPAPAAPGSSSANSPGGSAPALDLAQLQALCAIDLRRPLLDDPTAAQADQQPVVAAAPPGSALSLRLVGTAHEPGQSIALFQKPDGKIELCALGKTLDDPAGPVKVTHIEHRKVTVEFAGGSLELAIGPNP
jgi:hypothetical protein